jgi:hypothetical protein
MAVSIESLEEIPATDPRWGGSQTQTITIRQPVYRYRGWVIFDTGFKSSVCTIDLVMQVWAGREQRGDEPLLDYAVYASSTGISGRIPRGGQIDLTPTLDGSYITYDTLVEWQTLGVLEQEVANLKGKLLQRVIELIDEAEGTEA